MRTKITLFVVAALLACSFPAGSATAREGRTGERLLAVAEGLQMPSSESDSAWHLVSHTGVGELPETGAFEEISGCPRGGATRSDFDEALDRLSTVEPWMDAGQDRSARGFRKLEGVFDREFGDELAVYRCETGGPEVEIYFVGVRDDFLVGLMTVTIET